VIDAGANHAAIKTFPCGNELRIAATPGGKNAGKEVMKAEGSAG